jgi:hypothetical protein
MIQTLEKTPISRLSIPYEETGIISEKSLVTNSSVCLGVFEVGTAAGKFPLIFLK